MHYVRMYVRIYVCVHICKHMYVYGNFIYIYICVYVCVCVCVCVYNIDVYVHNMYIYNTCTRICAYVCVFELYFVFLFLKQTKLVTIMPVSKAMYIYVSFFTASKGRWISNIDTTVNGILTEFIWLRMGPTSEHDNAKYVVDCVVTPSILICSIEYSGGPCCLNFVTLKLLYPKLQGISWS